MFSVYPFLLWWLREHTRCLIIIIKSELWTLFRVRSWNNGVPCMSLYILMKRDHLIFILVQTGIIIFKVLLTYVLFQKWIIFQRTSVVVNVHEILFYKRGLFYYWLSRPSGPSAWEQDAFWKQSVRSPGILSRLHLITPAGSLNLVKYVQFGIKLLGTNWAHVWFCNMYMDTNWVKVIIVPIMVTIYLIYKWPRH